MIDQTFARRMAVRQRRLPRKLSDMGRLIGWIILIGANVVFAQTMPATTQAFHVAIPPGFVRIVVGNHTVIADPTDQVWINQTLRTLKPSTQPTTRPVDLAANLKTHHEAIRSQMMATLAIDDAGPVDQLLDETLRPLIDRYIQLDLPMVFMIVNRPKLKQLVADGWTDPHIRFNRASGDVEISRGVKLALEGPGDENLIVVLVPEPAGDAGPRELVTAVHSLDEQVNAQISNRAQADVQLTFIAWMAREGFDPLKLKPDQNWFSMGVCGVLSSHFAQLLDNISAEQFIGGLSTDRRDNPFHSADIDLMHPMPAADLRPVAVPMYADAYQRKAIRVVERWVKQAGLDAPAKVIAAMRDGPPQDGPALLKLIREKSGVDLSELVMPGH